MSLELIVIELGKVRFKEVEQKQEQLSELRAQDKIPDTILIAEHPPTITTGSNDEWNKIHIAIEELSEKGIEFYKSKRGGGATLLSPGQLVFYPIVDVSRFGGQWNYLRAIEEVAYEVSRNLGAATFLGKEYNSAIDKDYTCVWHSNGSEKKEKFLAQGYFVNGSRIISNGGFSVNIYKNSYENIKLIDHCGFKLDQVGITSFEDMLGYTPDKNLIQEKFLLAIQKKFNYEFITKGESSYAKA